MSYRFLALLVIVALLAAGAAFYYSGRPQASADGAIRVSGNIEVTEAEVSFKIPGRVVERLVSEGETVQAGQVVARLEDSELVREVGLRRPEVAAAEAVLGSSKPAPAPKKSLRPKAPSARPRPVSPSWKPVPVPRKSPLRRPQWSAPAPTRSAGSRNSTASAGCMSKASFPPSFSTPSGRAAT